MKDKNIYKKELFGSLVVMVGKPFDWSLNQLQNVDDLKLPRNGCLFERVRALSHENGIKMTFAPRLVDESGSHFANIVTVENFHSSVYDERSDFSIWRGARGAGVDIPQGKGAIIPTADCYSIFARMTPNNRSNSMAILAHASLESLVNTPRALGNDLKRKEEGVVDNIIETSKNYGSIEDLYIHIFGGIAPEHFTYPLMHPKYGERNRKILRYIDRQTWGRIAIEGDRISLPKIIQGQAVSRGVDLSNITVWEGDSFADIDDKGYGRWYSYRNGDKKGRNLTFCAHL